MDRGLSEVREPKRVKALIVEKKLGLDVGFMHGRKVSSRRNSRPKQSYNWSFLQ